jgi:hypothetical protein
VPEHASGVHIGSLSGGSQIPPKLAQRSCLISSQPPSGRQQACTRPPRVVEVTTIFVVVVAQLGSVVGSQSLFEELQAASANTSPHFVMERRPEAIAFFMALSDSFTAFTVSTNPGEVQVNVALGVLPSLACCRQ